VTHNDWVSTVAGFSQKKPTLLSGCYDGFLRLFTTKMDKTQLQAQAQAHIGPITAIHIDEKDEESYVATAGKDHMAILWKIGAGFKSFEPIVKMEGANCPLQTIVINPAGTRCVTAGWDCHMRLYKYENIHQSEYGVNSNQLAPSISEFAILGSHTLCVTGLSWTSESNLYSCSMDQSLRKWDLDFPAAPKCSNILKTNRAVTCVDTCPIYNNNIVAYGSTDGILRIWDSRDKTCREKNELKTFSSHTEWLSTISWCPKREFLLASGSFDGSIVVWDIRVETPLATISRAHNGKVLSISWFKPEMITSGGTDCKLKFYEFDFA
jgi:ribosome biogenesis protein YTM1